MRRCKDGFTLLEILVALIIASAALTALWQGAGVGLVAADHATRVDQALSRARSRLTQAAAWRPREGEQSGDDGGGYHWQLHTRRAAIQKPRLLMAPASVASTARLSLYDITTTITWREDGRERSVSLTTAAFAPDDADGL